MFLHHGPFQSYGTAPLTVSVSVPAGGGLATVQSSPITFSSGTTTAVITPTSTLGGTWSPSTLSLNSGNSWTATAQVTPAAQGPVNTIGVVGATGTANFPVYSKITPTTQADIAVATRTAAYGTATQDSSLVFISTGGGNFNVYASASGGSGIAPVKVTGTLANP